MNFELGFLFNFKPGYSISSLFTENSQIEKCTTSTWIVAAFYVDFCDL